VSPERSLVTIEVRRAGSLARFGHDHVVASRDLRGYVAPDEGRADLYVPLERLTVDEPALRQAAGFATTPSEDDIAGTRGNMLDKVLEADRFPFARIRVSGTGAGAGTMGVEITLHGTTRALEAPVQVDRRGDEIDVSGRLALDQSDFGIKPFSILGGAVQVQDRIELRFRITATRGFLIRPL
jgi:polyisoprenoid-binding protein YceI